MQLGILQFFWLTGDLGGFRGLCGLFMVSESLRKEELGCFSMGF
jgi:hypothetical protein